MGVLKAPPVSAEGFVANGSLLASSSVTSCVPPSVTVNSTKGSPESAVGVGNITAALHRLSIPGKGMKGVGVGDMCVYHCSWKEWGGGGGEGRAE